MIVSVVIVNFNRRDDLKVALNSVMRQDYLAVEVIVVDNGSVDGSQNTIRDEFPGVTLIENSRNTGMDGYSVACRAASGDIIFQMDNDSEMPTADVISKMVRAFDNSPKNTAIIACRVAEFVAGRDSVSALLNEFAGAALTSADGYHAGGVAFRRSLLDQSGYYNEEVFLYGAELFVQMQVLEAGFGIRYAPAILMLHKASRAARSSRGLYYEVRNRIWFFRRYGTRAQQLAFLPRVLIHDFAYGLHRKALKQFKEAVLDGFGRLPNSLGVQKKVNTRMVHRAVSRAGKNLGLRVTFRRIASKLWDR